MTDAKASPSAKASPGVEAPSKPSFQAKVAAQETSAATNTASQAEVRIAEKQTIKHSQNILGDESDHKKTEQAAKKKRAKKDPAAPRKAATAYLLFGAEERPRIRVELGNLPMAQESAEVARRWALVPGEQRARLEGAAARDRERYRGEMVAYTASTKVEDGGMGRDMEGISTSVSEYFAFLFSQWSAERAARPEASPKVLQEALWARWSSQSAQVEQEVQEPTRKRVKKVRDPLAPKRPASAFLLWQNSRREAVRAARPELAYREVVAELSREWQAMGEEAKAPFLAQYQQLVLAHNTAVREWKARKVEGEEVKREGDEVKMEDEEMKREGREEGGEVKMEGEEMKIMEDGEVKMEGGELKMENGKVQESGDSMEDTMDDEFLEECAKMENMMEVSDEDGNSVEREVNVKEKSNVEEEGSQD